METIIQVLRELEGVRGAFVFDSSGQMLAHRSHAVYDKPLLDNVSQNLVKAIDSLQIQQSDWESMVVHFAEGKLLLKNLKSHILALIADATLNIPFANVAMRVAEQKLKKVIDNGGMTSSSHSLPGSQRNSGSMDSGGSLGRDSGIHANKNSGMASGIGSGIGWSGTGSSGMSSSAVPTADEASANYLTRCSKAMAQFVGPMSKVFLKESVRRICVNSAFSLKDVPQVLQDLQKHFSEPGDFEKFKKMVGK